ncbi:hypothetical protein POX65_25845, partial [Klebsiella pneumoniae]
GGTADRNRSHWSTSKTPSYTKSVSWQHHPNCNGYQVTIIPHEDGFGNFHWFRGAYRLSGHFYIDALAVPYQGLMVAVISAAKTI